MAYLRMFQLFLVKLLIAHSIANIILKDQQVIIMDMETEDQRPYKLSFGDHKAVFQDWKAKHAPKYGNEWNEEERFHIFSDNLATIEHHNWLYHTNKSSFYMGLNQFTAMTHDEYQSYNRIGKHSIRQAGTNFESAFDCKDLNVASSGDSHAPAIPEAVDWTKKGYVTPVKEQGHCGSCWAFSATGAIEGAYYKSHHKLVSFSEQQILDCCHTDDCSACEGGYPTAAYTYIYEAHGLDTEQVYPYDETQGRCKVIASKTVGKLTKCYKVSPSGSEDALKTACATEGPISVAIDASQNSFQLYAGGVYSEPLCNSDPLSLDHAVLLTGYATTHNKQDYWIVKNSWGDSWGQNGYIWMARNQENACGIADQATFPIYG